MNFTKIIKETWQIVRKHRYLWWLGILTLGVEGGGGFNFGSFNFNGSDINGSTNSTSISTQIQDAGHTASTDIANWIMAYWSVAIILLIVAICIAILLIYVAYSSKGGLIKSVNAVDKNDHKLTFSKAFSLGTPFAWRLFGLDVFIGLFILALILIIVPLIVLAFVWPNIGTIGIAVIVGLVCLIALIPFCLYLGMLARFSARHLVIKNDGVLGSIAAGNAIIRKNLGNSLLIWLVNLVINLVFGILLVVAMFVILGILVALGLAFYALAHTIGAVIFGVIFGLAFIIACVIIGGFYTSFVSTYWTLSYKELVK